MEKLIEIYNKALDFVFEHKWKFAAGILVIAVLWSVTSCVDVNVRLPVFND